MNELFAWVPWFKELAQKIADGGPEYLARHAREIPWNTQGESALVRYGDENTIDPFSFFRFLASKNEPPHWERVHPAISRHFGLTTGSSRDFDQGYYFPASKQQLLFHQLLAYATALGLPGGMLVYAKGEQGPAVHQVRNCGKQLEVFALDLAGEPAEILAQISELAARVRALALRAPVPRAA